MVQFQTQIWKIPTKGDTFELRSIKNTTVTTWFDNLSKLSWARVRCNPVFEQPHISDPSILCAYTGENYAMGDWMFGAQVRPAQLGGGGVKVVVVWWWCGGSVVVGTVWHSWDVSNSAVHSALHQKLEYQRSVVTRYGIQTWDNRHRTSDYETEDNWQRDTGQQTNEHIITD